MRSLLLRNPKANTSGGSPKPARPAAWARCAVLMVSIATPVLTPTPVAAGDDFWTAHIEPLLKERCLECHNPTKSKSGLDLSGLQSILKGGDRGPSVFPGRPKDSLLFQVLAADADPHMPPKRQLSEEQTGLIRTWIEKLGATQSHPEAVAQPGTSNGVAAAKAPAKKTSPAWVPPARMPAPEVIDRFINLGLKARGAKAAPVCDDATFVRRLYLDLLGRIPNPAEMQAFVNNRSRQRRTELIDALLTHPEHARHLRDVFDVVLMGRRGADFESKRTNNKWYDFLETRFRENAPWDKVVRELIVARPTSPEERGAVWYLYERQNNPQAMAESVAPVVFGVQIKCAQCHDHMVAREIKQAHYWGMVAAFNRSKNTDTTSGIGIAESAIGGFSSFANLKKESQPAFLTFFNGKRVEEPWPKEGEKELDSPEKYRVPPPAGKDRPETPATPKFSRREALADAVTRDNPLLARAFVNRLWALFLGRGMVHPVDLMDSKHPPSHPELLDWLAADFEKSGYDTRRLIRNLVLTQTYQRDSRVLPAKTSARKPSNAERAKAPAESGPTGESFARGLEKPLSAEQLFRSLLLATGNAPGTDGRIHGKDEGELRRAFVKQFPDLFAAEYNATLQQALFLSNSPLFDALLEPHPGNLTARLAALREPEAQVREAFRTVFHRQPDAEELRKAADFLRATAGRNPEKQLVWAFLTSAEFQVNH